MAKSRKRRPTQPKPGPWDMGPSAPAARRDTVIEDRGEADPVTGKTVNPNGVKGVRRQPVLETYRGQGRITAAQCEAGLRLYALWSGDVDRDPTAPKTDRMGSGSDPLAGAVDARAEYRKAWAAVPRPAQSAVEWVALNDERLGLQADDAGIHWRETRARMVALRMGLDALSAHFRTEG
ncbi:MAG TPA: hypothetical protein DEB52_16845 [Hyphomonas sp.]|jgi:hypothetical protein|nr:hypothetical protein [Hyphomonas sp.]HBT37604.1 hypothetical protein [Hyphomonas sp.]|tara:strand:+ start:110 stop:646 length:537 start_codon:yes stop_codon:yes gene_type:complete